MKLLTGIFGLLGGYAALSIGASAMSGAVVLNASSTATLLAVALLSAVLIAFGLVPILRHGDAPVGEAKLTFVRAGTHLESREVSGTMGKSNARLSDLFVSLHVDGIIIELTLDSHFAISRDEIVGVVSSGLLLKNLFIEHAAPDVPCPLFLRVPSDSRIEMQLRHWAATNNGDVSD